MNDTNLTGSGVVPHNKNCRCDKCELNRLPRLYLENKKLRSRVKELECQLEAWRTSFGTSQLSHALARLDTAEARVAELKQALAEAKQVAWRDGRQKMGLALIDHIEAICDALTERDTK